MKNIFMQSTDFFKGVRQSILKIGEYDTRVPMFYQSVTSMGIFLLASLEKVKGILPTNRLYPYRVTPWHCVLTITAFEYRETDIGPYNQVSIGIPVFWINHHRYLWESCANHPRFQ
jgi:hypothetical protein